MYVPHIFKYAHALRTAKTSQTREAHLNQLRTGMQLRRALQTEEECMIASIATATIAAACS